jgi:RNA polymerase sigma-70 factor (ECF subfamily)
VRPAPPSSLSDDLLVDRARARDLAAFEELVGRHEERLYRVAMRLLRNENDRREVLQDALLSGLAEPGWFRRTGSQFGTWIYRVTVNWRADLAAVRGGGRPTVSVEDMTAADLDEAVDESMTSAGGDWSKRPDEQLQSGELKAHIQQALGPPARDPAPGVPAADVEGLFDRGDRRDAERHRPDGQDRLHRARLALRQSINEYFERN